jgi:hypothetical protein
VNPLDGDSRSNWECIACPSKAFTYTGQADFVSSSTTALPGSTAADQCVPINVQLVSRVLVTLLPTMSVTALCASCHPLPYLLRAQVQILMLYRHLQYADSAALRAVSAQCYVTVALLNIASCPSPTLELLAALPFVISSPATSAINRTRLRARLYSVAT